MRKAKIQMMGDRGRIFAAGTAVLFASTFLSGPVRAADTVFNVAGQVYTTDTSGTGGVVIAASPVTFTGTNTYSGATTINSGAGLDVTSSPTANASLSPNSAFIVNGTLGGGSFASNQAIGSLAGASTGLINTQGMTLTAGGDNTSTTFAGRFASTSGSFTKVGTGTQTLSGTGSALTGNLGVNAGTLALTGTLTSATTTVANAATLNVASGGALTSAVTGAAGSTTMVNGTVTGNLANAGTLSGTGTVAGTVTNSGTVAPGNNGVGILNVNGSYVQTSAGTLAADVSSSAVAGTGYDQVRVTGAPGTATLAGRLAVNPLSGLYVAGSTYDVVSASGGITGNFATITGNTISPFITLTPTGIVTTAGTSQAYRLTVVRTSYATGIGASATPNQVGVATGFQGLVTGATGDAATLVIATDNMTAAQARSFFDQLSPEPYGAYATALSGMGDLFTRQVALQLHETPNTAEGVSLWGRGYGQWGRGRDRDLNFGTDQDIYGGALGLDVRRGTVVFGIAGGYSHDDLEYRFGNSNGNAHSWQVGAYADLSAGPIDFDIQAAYIHGRFHASRSINTAAIVRTADARFSGNLWRVIGTVGYKADLGSVTLRPFAGIDYSDGKIKSFSETGAGAADLSVQEIKIRRTDLLVGVDLGTNATSAISPYARFAYRYGLKNRDRFITAAFNDNPATSFTVSGVRQGRSEFDVDAGLSFAVSPRASLFVGYQGTFRNDLRSHGVSGGFRLSFGGQEPAARIEAAPPPPPPPPPPPAAAPEPQPVQPPPPPPAPVMETPHHPRG